MKNFETIVNLYARQASSVTGLPPNYFGLVSDDAASDAAIRSRETQLVKYAERQQSNFSRPIRGVAQLVDRIITGEWRPEMRSLEVVWQDAGTPTKAQVTDAAVKLKESDVLTREDVWEELNYSPARIEVLKKRFEERDRVVQDNGVNSAIQLLAANEGRPDANASGVDPRDIPPTPEPQ
jgi:hypothetical protein